MSQRGIADWSLHWTVDVPLVEELHLSTHHHDHASPSGLHFSSSPANLWVLYIYFLSSQALLAFLHADYFQNHIIKTTHHYLVFSLCQMDTFKIIVPFVYMQYFTMLTTSSRKHPSFGASALGSGCHRWYHTFYFSCLSLCSFLCEFIMPQLAIKC